MLRRLRVMWLCPALALVFVGCALNTVRPPTPATHLEANRDELPLPNEHYYVLIWAWQRFPKMPNTSHSFATVVHTADSAGGQPKILDAHTISWLPATLTIHSTQIVPEPGINLTLKEGMEHAREK